MSGFDEREKGFENQFKHDQDLKFKVTARRNRMIGHWAAAKLGLTGDEAATYAMSIVETELVGGERRVIAKLVADLTAAGVAITEAQIKFELDHFAATAKQQLMLA